MQTRKHSVIESVLNTLSGLLLATLIMSFVIAPFYHLPTTIGENLQINIVFTIVSVLRGYAWRRYFNRKATK